MDPFSGLRKQVARQGGSTFYEMALSNAVEVWRQVSFARGPLGRVGSL